MALNIWKTLSFEHYTLSIFQLHGKAWNNYIYGFYLTLCLYKHRIDRTVGEKKKGFNDFCRITFKGKGVFSLAQRVWRQSQIKQQRTTCLCCRSLILLIAQGKDLSALVNLPQPQYKAPRSLFPCLADRIKLSCHSNRQHRESLVHLGSLTDGYLTPIIWVPCAHVWARAPG